MPSQSQVRVVRPLSNMFLGAAKIRGFVGRYLVPEVTSEVAQQMFRLSAADTQRFMANDITDGGVANILDYAPDTVNMDPRVRGYKHLVTKRNALAGQGALNADGQKRMGMNLIARRHQFGMEYYTAAKLQNTSVYNNEAAAAAFGVGGDDPIGDVYELIEDCAAQSGVFPNTLVFPYKTWFRWLKTSEVQAEFATYMIGGAAAGLASHKAIQQAIAERYGDAEFQIFVAQGQYNSAGFGASASMADFWVDGKVTCGYFNRDLPQLKALGNDKPVGAFGESTDELNLTNTPAIVAMGPQHGESREWEDQETGDMWFRVNADYSVETGVTESCRILTGA